MPRKRGVGASVGPVGEKVEDANYTKGDNVVCLTTAGTSR